MSFLKRQPGDTVRVTINQLSHFQQSANDLYKLSHGDNQHRQTECDQEMIACQRFKGEYGVHSGNIQKAKRERRTEGYRAPQQEVLKLHCKQ
jgi:nitrite reductase/ring-hydroxylating ferredoxin subunit